MKEATSEEQNRSIKEDVKPPEQLYYMENGLMVFTAAYHLARGFCCKNGCRHCPYGFRKKQ
ncbi:MAG: hypothetical protein JSS76_03395 [Bacteroidetes bacterium]|nr:hypothetical protein [Bacteroidota bacterium]MBS1683770.1 hypothetical protein [Bacteroidota bacterium]